MKKIKKLDKYVIKPNLAFYGGYNFNGEDIELCDDYDEIKNEEGVQIYTENIKQYIENNVLYTKIEIMRILKNGKKVLQNESQEIEIEKGQLLVYVQHRGFVISEYQMLTIDDAQKLYECLRGDQNDTEGNEE